MAERAEIIVETRDEPKNTFRYRILRYVPNISRDEWVNIGVLLEETHGSRRVMRLIQDEAELARVRRIHPDMDEELLRTLPYEFDARLRGANAEVSMFLEKLEQNLSNLLQFSPQKGVFADNFDEELARLYQVQVSPPLRKKVGNLQSQRDFMRVKLNDVFRRHRILNKLVQNVPIEGFTHPGDPMTMDYGYQNGTRGFIQTISLRRDIQQAKILAYTAERIHSKDSEAKITAITEEEASSTNRRHQFVESLFAEQKIDIVPMNHVESFAEKLRVSLR
jgi:Protein of unknown function (DUF3037)